MYMQLTIMPQALLHIKQQAASEVTPIKRQPVVSTYDPALRINQGAKHIQVLVGDVLIMLHPKAQRGDMPQPAA